MHWRPRTPPRNSERLEDHGPGGELEEGLILERRLILWLPAALTLGLAGCPRRATPVADEPPAPPPRRPDADERPHAHDPLARLDFAGFRAAWLALAGQLRGDGTRVDAYLHALAALAVRLDERTAVPLTPSRSLGPDVEFGEQLREAPLLATQWRLRPGASLGPHNHPPFAGVTLGLEGHCWLRSYALPGDVPRPPSGSTFHLRLVAEESCGPGRVVSAIGPIVNVHETLPTAAGARGVDLYVALNEDRHFAPLTLDGPPDGPTRSVRARWGAER